MNIIFVLIMILLLVPAIFLLRGRGANLIAGYNTLSEAQRASYDEKALCRAVGWLLIVLCVCMGVAWAGIHFGLSWVIWVGTALMIALPIAGAIYTNTGGRFLKEGAQPQISAADKKRNKRVLVVVAVISAVALIGVGALFIAGEREPRVEFLEDSLRIRAMYGLEVEFAEIAGITLLEQSMREIGPGMRMNGYNGGALRGHFASGLLFVRANSAPTIRIERERGQNIYLSLRDSEATRALYNEIVEEAGL